MSDTFAFETQITYFDTSEEALDRAVRLYWVRRNAALLTRNA